MNHTTHEPNDHDRDAYDAFREGTRLLAGDNAHAAVIALEQARDLEPAQGSVREALAARTSGRGASRRPRRSSTPRSRSIP